MNKLFKFYLVCLLKFRYRMCVIDFTPKLYSLKNAHEDTIFFADFIIIYLIIYFLVYFFAFFNKFAKKTCCYEPLY